MLKKQKVLTERIFEKYYSLWFDYESFNVIETYPKDQDNSNYNAITNVLTSVFKEEINYKNSFFGFTVTNWELAHVYCYCQIEISKNIIRCFLTNNPWFEAFEIILHCLQEQNDQSDICESILKSLYILKVPLAETQISLTNEYTFTVPDIFDHARLIKQLNTSVFNIEISEFVALVVMTLLLEQSVMIVSNDVSKLTSFMFGILGLMHPLPWLHDFTAVFTPDQSINRIKHPCFIGMLEEDFKDIKDSYAVKNMASFNIDKNKKNYPLDIYKENVQNFGEYWINYLMLVPGRHTGIDDFINTYYSFMKQTVGKYTISLEHDIEKNVIIFNDTFFISKIGDHSDMITKFLVRSINFHQLIQSRLDFFKKIKRLIRNKFESLCFAYFQSREESNNRIKFRLSELREKDRTLRESKIILPPNKNLLSNNELNDKVYEYYYSSIDKTNNLKLPTRHSNQGLTKKSFVIGADKTRSLNNISSLQIDNESKESTTNNTNASNVFNLIVDPNKIQTEKVLNKNNIKNASDTKNSSNQENESKVNPQKVNSISNEESKNFDSTYEIPDELKTLNKIVSDEDTKNSNKEKISDTKTLEFSKKPQNFSENLINQLQNHNKNDEELNKKKSIYYTRPKHHNSDHTMTTSNTEKTNLSYSKSSINDNAYLKLDKNLSSPDIKEQNYEWYQKKSQLNNNKIGHKFEQNTPTQDKTLTSNSHTFSFQTISNSSVDNKVLNSDGKQSCSKFNEDDSKESFVSETNFSKINIEKYDSMKKYNGKKPEVNRTNRPINHSRTASKFEKPDLLISSSETASLQRNQSLNMNHSKYQIEDKASANNNEVSSNSETIISKPARPPPKSRQTINRPTTKPSSENKTAEGDFETKKTSPALLKKLSIKIFKHHHKTKQNEEMSSKKKYLTFTKK